MTQETDTSDMNYFSAAIVFVPAGNSTGHDALWRTTSTLIGPWHELQLQIMIGLEQLSMSSQA